MPRVLNISEAASLAMHTAVLLAARKGESLSAGQIAATLDVSEAHLAKVLQRLGKAGIVRSTRGPHGGFVLARAGSQISLLRVYEAIEGALVESDCLLGSRICHGANCILGCLVQSVNSKVRDYLRKKHLSDLTGVYARAKVAGARRGRTAPTQKA
jgi:Rrf2 family protein